MDSNFPAPSFPTAGTVDVRGRRRRLFDLAGGFDEKETGSDLPLCTYLSGMMLRPIVEVAIEGGCLSL